MPDLIFGFKWQWEITGVTTVSHDLHAASHRGPCAEAGGSDPGSDASPQESMKKS